MSEEAYQRANGRSALPNRSVNGAKRYEGALHGIRYRCDLGKLLVRLGCP